MCWLFTSLQHVMTQSSNSECVGLTTRHRHRAGPMVFASILYAKLLAIPLVVSYHTHIPEYIPRYTWKGLVGPMWGLIRFAARMADLTLVTSKVMKVHRAHGIS